IQAGGRHLSRKIKVGKEKWGDFWWNIHESIQSLTYEELRAKILSLPWPRIQNRAKKILYHPWVERGLQFLGGLLKQIYSFFACLVLFFVTWLKRGCQVLFAPIFFLKEVCKRGVALLSSKKKRVAEKFPLLSWLKMGFHFLLVSCVIVLILLQW